jgi:hypothetical protein
MQLLFAVSLLTPLGRQSFRIPPAILAGNPASRKNSMSAPTIALPGSVQRDVKITSRSQQDIRRLADAVRPDLSQQEIASLAYSIWQERGCPLGSAEEDWFEAKRRLQVDSAKSLAATQ